MNAANSAMNGDNSQQQQGQMLGPQNPLSVPQIHMDTSDVDMADGSSENGADLDRTAVRNGTSNGLCANGVTDIECDMGKFPALRWRSVSTPIESYKKLIMCWLFLMILQPSWFSGWISGLSRSLFPLLHGTDLRKKTFK